MGTNPERRLEFSVLMLLRRFGFGRNPLRRRVDRVESAVLLGVLVAGLLVVPGAAALGTTIRNRFEHAATQRRAELHSVQARTLEKTAQAVPAGRGQVATRVRVQWHDASGSPHEGRADVLIGTEAGSALTIWLDRFGAIAPAPREPADSVALGVATGFTVPMVVWPLLWGLFRIARRILGRRRADGWEREWEQVAPRWTRTE